MSEWKIKNFEDVCIVDKECLPATISHDYEFIYISLSDVEKGRVLPSITLTTYRKAPSRARRVVHKNDILIATVRPNLQAFALLREVAKHTIASTGFAVLSEREKYSNDYIYHYLYSDYITKQINTFVVGSNYPAISSNDIKKLKIFIPRNLPHQRKIARILTTVDNIIEKTENSIEKYKAIKQGMMHDLSTRGIDVKTGKLRPSYEDAPELYKETELGMIPKEWDVERLENITDQIGDGIHTTPKYVNNSEYFFINGNNLEDGKIVVDEKTNCVNKSEFKKHYIALGEHTILISINGTIGNIARYRGEKVILGKSAAYINCGKKVLWDYIYQFLQSYTIKKYFNNELTGSTIKNLSLNSIRNTPTFLPPYMEQVEIAQKISSLDLKVEIEQNFLSKTKLFKQALMQDLLTGKKEVTPDPEDFDDEP